MQIYMMVFNNVPLLPDWYLSKDDIFPQRLSETLLQMPLVASWLQHTDNLYLCKIAIFYNSLYINRKILSI